MKTAICYDSRRHSSIRKVLAAMTAGQEVDLIDVTARTTVQLEQYTIIGFASGIYYNKYSDVVINFARQYLPERKQVFFVYTYDAPGAPNATATKGITDVAAEKHATILGEYSCRRSDPFGTSKLAEDIATGRPTADALVTSKAFFQGLIEPH